MNIERASIQQAFENYISQFDMTDERVSLKVDHTAHVAENSDKISSSLGLSQEQKDIAWTIAMLHDIGRFEQAVRMHTFVDTVCCDHAEEGVKYLFGQGAISSFLSDGSCSSETLECIRIAIQYHNKHLLPDNLSEQNLLFCNIIRDADKLDIFRIHLANSFEVVHEYPKSAVETSRISPAVIDCFKKQETLDYSKRQYPADIFLGHIAMCFGLVYPCSRKMASEQGYIETIMDFSFTGTEEQTLYEDMKASVQKFLSGN